ncbi:glycyl radical enzyme domain-containing protein [Shigella flexneri]
MPTSHENALSCQQIVTSPVLSPEQKRHFLHWKQKTICLTHSSPAEARRALDEGVICDMFEGHAPYKPRLRLTPSRLVFWRTVPNGWSWKARIFSTTHSLS